MPGMSSGRPAASPGSAGDGIPRDAWLRLAACAGAAALLQMDGTIVTVALPSVGEELDVGLARAVLRAHGLLPGVRGHVVSGRGLGRPHRLAPRRTGRLGRVRRRGAARRAGRELRGAGRVARRAGRRRGACQPGIACRRRFRLPGRAARHCAWHLGSELRCREPDRPGRGRPADGRDRLARVLVVPDSRERRRSVGAVAAGPGRACRRRPGYGGTAPAGCCGCSPGRGPHVRRHDRRVLHRRSSTCRVRPATRRWARPRRSR